MSRRGDDEGFRPHPGDPWHPGWSSEGDAEPGAPSAAEPVAPPAAGPVAPPAAGPAITPEPRPAAGGRRRFGRGRRRGEPEAERAVERLEGDEAGREPEPELEGPAPVLPEDGLAGWWATGITVDSAPSRDTPAALPAEEGDENGEEAPSAALLPWWDTAAPATPPAPAAPPEAQLLEAPPSPGKERRAADAASLIPLGLPAEPPARPVAPEPVDQGLWERPVAIPVIPPMAAEGIWTAEAEPAEAEPAEAELPLGLEGGAEAATLHRWDEPVVIPVIPPIPVMEVPPEGAEPDEAEPGGVEVLLGPGEPEAAGAEPSAASVAEELARATAALLAEIGGLPAVVEPLEPVAEAGGGEALDELPWAPASPAVREAPAPTRDRSEDLFGGEEIETPAGEAGAPALLDDGQPAAAGPLVPPASVAAEPGPEDLVPESEVDEWAAFVAGFPADAATAPQRAADAPAAPETSGGAEAPEDWEIGGPAAVTPATSRRRGWFRRRRGQGEEGPEQSWDIEAEEAAPAPPPWAAGEAPGETPGAAEAGDSLLDDAAEAEAAWAAWETGVEGAAGQQAVEPPPVVLPEPEIPAVPGETVVVPPPVIPFAAGRGELPPDEADVLFEGAEWAGEPEAAGDWFAAVDEDEVEVPPAGLPEEGWEADDELPTAAGFPEPEPEPEEDLEAAGWEAFPEPGRPLAHGEGRLAPPAAGPEPTAAPVAPGPEAPAGWELFPEPGSRAPGRSAGTAPWGPRPIPGPEPVFPESEGIEEEDEAAWAAEAGVGATAHDGPPPVPTSDQRTMEMPTAAFDFEAAPRLQGPISEEVLAGAVTMEHRGLAEEMLAADTAETELQAVSAPMPGLESGVVGFEDVAHLGSDEEMTAPVRSDLPIRVATGMVLALMLLGALWVGGEFFAGFVGVMAVLGLGEFYGSLRRCGYQPLALFGFLGAAGMLTGTWFYGPVALPIATVATVILSFFYYAFAPHRRDALTNGGLALLGMLWVIGTAAFAFPIAASSDFRVLVLATAVTVIATDVGAFFAGRSWGRRLMAPVLSPRKTWEGLAGGVVLGIGAAVGAGYLFDEIGIRAGAALGLVVAVMAPLGDLAESMVKRSLRLKDMGSILPGHGGILDRIDAFLFVLPAAWVLFETMGLLR